MWRWDDFLRQPVVRGVAALPTSGQAEGLRTFSLAPAPIRTPSALVGNGRHHGNLGYMPPRLGWRVQVANETTPSGQVKTYGVFRHGVGRAGGRYVGRAQRRQQLRTQQRGVGKLGTAAVADLNGMPFLNLMPDSGRFAGIINPLILRFTGSFSSVPLAVERGDDYGRREVYLRQHHKRRDGGQHQPARPRFASGDGTAER